MGKYRQVAPVGSPLAALAAFGISADEFRTYVRNVADTYYPGLKVAPPYRVYDENRCGGWPTALSLCFVSGLPKGGDGWEQFCQAILGRPVVTMRQTADLAWKKRKKSEAGVALSDAERTAIRRRDEFGWRAGRSKLARHHEHRPSYRDDRFGAIKKWRPIYEWRPLVKKIALPGGGVLLRQSKKWGYVQTGEYSVWQLI